MTVQYGKGGTKECLAHYTDIRSILPYDSSQTLYSVTEQLSLTFNFTKPLR